MMNDQATKQTLSKVIMDQAVNAWVAQSKIISNYFSNENEDFYLREIAPGKNRGIYILGHLVAANDNILPLLGKGEKKYPELEPIFLTNPDKTSESIPSFDDLKKMWDAQTAEIEAQMKQIPAEEWLDRHTRVSAEDFSKEPHRNKLSILLSRTNHTSYHAGQLALLKTK